MIFTQRDIIDADDLILTSPDGMELADDFEDRFAFATGGSLEELERAYILHILETHDSSYADIADLLGISKKTLWEKRKRYNLDEVVSR